MALGYILIKTNPAMEKKVFEGLVKKDISAVKDCHILFGEYDLIVKVDVPHFSDIATLITSEIRPLNGINETKTLIVHT